MKALFCIVVASLATTYASTREISFDNKQAKITLAGTLSLPDNKESFSTVLLIAGMGKNDRNGHKLNPRSTHPAPLLAITKHLEEKGVGVLRYDKRGIAASEGDFSSSTTEDFASDAEAALQFLREQKDIDQERIGLIGHSEGGLIAAMIASRYPELAFVITLGPPGLPGEELILQKVELTPEQYSNIDRETAELLLDLVKGPAGATLKTSFLHFYEELFDSKPNEKFTYLIERATSPWLRYFLTITPGDYFKKVQAPLLCLGAEKDLQVPVAGNIAAIEKALQQGSQPLSRVEVLPSHNHMFQRCKTGGRAESKEIEESISPLTLQKISDWVDTK